MAKIRPMIYIAMFSAVLAVCSQITFPLPSGVPVTLQTFAVALIGFALGAKRGALSVLIWCALGLVGVPVFSGLMGGPAVLLGKTGGFIVGFIPMTRLCGLASQRKTAAKLFLSLAGLLLCHLCGIIQFSLLSGADFVAGALLVSLPYFLKDVLSVFLAERFAKSLKPILSALKR